MAFLGVFSGGVGRSSAPLFFLPVTAQDGPHNTEYNYMYKLQIRCQLLIIKTVIGCDDDGGVLVKAWYCVAELTIAPPRRFAVPMIPSP
jgi:hypothetical protein